MAAEKIHSTDRAPAVEMLGTDDGRYGYDLLQTSVLYNIRDVIEAQNGLARETLRVLRRIDKRLARRVKLR